MTKKTRGAEFSIGTTATAHADDTYLKIGGAKSLPGTFGTTWGAIDATTLDDIYRQEVKGLADAGAIDLAGNYDTGDAGIEALETANQEGDDDTPHNFKILFSNGAIVYFKARVMSFTLTPGGPTNLLEYRSRLKLTAAHVVVPAV